jgi:hypothetical protein
MKMKTAFVIAGLLLVFACAGCAPGLFPTATLTPTLTEIPTPLPSVTPTVPPTATPSPTPIVFDGTWSGVTADGNFPITIVIKNNTVVNFSFEFSTAGCKSQTTYDIKNDPRSAVPPLNEGAFVFGISNDSFSYQFRGTFLTPTRAAGILKADSKGCSTIDTTWEIHPK